MMRSSIDNDDAEKRPQYKVIILGKPSVGKTKLLTRYLQGFYQDSGQPTIAVDFVPKKREKATYLYYDTAGQQVFKSIIDVYYRGADACIIVYDISNPASLDDIPFYYKKVKEMAEQSLIYVIGCKSDLPSKVSTEEIAEKYQDVNHFITSSKLNTNVFESFSEIQNDLLKLKPKKLINTSRLSSLKYQTNNLKEKKKKQQCCK